MKTRVRIADVKIGTRYRQNMGDLDALSKSMDAIGLLHPIGVTKENELVFGQRRLRAAKLLGWDSIPAHVVDIDKLMAEQDENVARKDFTISERVAVADAIKARQPERRGRPSKEITVESQEIPRGVETANYAAKQAGIDSDATYRRAKKVIDGATPELAQAMDEGLISIDLAAQFAKRYDADQQRAVVARIRSELDAGKRSVNPKSVARKLSRESAIARIESEPQALPEGPFRVIVADPPWPYEKRSEDGTSRNQLGYPTMSIDEICALPVASRAHDDCILWLWTTNAFMREAFEVLDAWGFKEKTILTWVKERMGTGDWLRGKSEHCILAIRGKPVVNLTNQTTVLGSIVREQSRKPDAFYTLVQALCPGNKLEIFAREQREGWTAWGAEFDKFDPDQMKLPSGTADESTIEPAEVA